MRAIDKLLPGLVALHGYNRSWFGYDLMAGFSVAAVGVPVAIAYSQLAGVPPVHGLYASILPLVAYALFGSSRQLIMAPDAATCAIVGATLAPLAGGDAARYVSLSMILSMMTGLFCIAAGVAKLGFLTNFLARPVLTGYLNGIALSIISGQLGTLFGFSLKPMGVFRLLFEFFSKLGETHYLTLTVGIGIFATLRILKHLTPNIPAPLIAVVLGIAATALFDLGGRGVTLVGAIPAGLPWLMIPTIAPRDLEPLAFGAIGLAFISFNSAMVTARSFAVKNRYEIDSNQEFIALGVADLAAGLSQGFAISGADSRTAVNDSVGGKTQITGLVAAAVLIAVLLFFTEPLSLLPVTVLAAVLINAALSLFDLHSLLRLRQVSHQEFRLSLVASLGVITVGVLPGVLIAVGLAIIQLLARASRPNDAVLGQISGADGFYNVNSRPDVETLPGLIIYRFDSSLVFFNADYLKTRIRTVVAEAKTKPRWLIVDGESMPWIDTTGAAILDEVRNDLAEKNIIFAIARPKRALRFMLDKTGLKEKIGRGMVFPTLGAAVEAFKQTAQVRPSMGSESVQSARSG